MTESVNYELSDGIAQVTLQNGKVNAMSPSLTQAINEALDKAEQDKAAVMLVGQPGIFSAGFDLKVFEQNPAVGAEMVTAGSRLCHRLLAFPYPVVAACTGHAVAQGCFILLACDYRVGVKGSFTLGLNETQIGLTMHNAGIAIARDRLGRQFFNRCVVNAEMFDPDTAVSAGFLDCAVSSEALLDVARQELKRLAAFDGKTFATNKLKSREVLLQTLDQAIAQDSEHFRDLLSQ